MTPAQGLSQQPQGVTAMTRWKILLLAAALGSLLLAGCAPSGPKLRVLWPPPPDQPRLEWLGVYSSQDSFPKTGFQVFLEGVLGKPPLAVFKSPYGIVADDKGVVYVSDMHDHNLRVYDMNARTVNYYSKEAIFGAPRGLALDPAGNLYVADAEKGRVLVFAPDKTPLKSIGSPDELKNPAYLAINPRLGRLYVSDSKAQQIVVYSLKGERLFAFGSRGSAEGEFNFPQGMAIDAEDRLFVADSLNARIQVFDADGKFQRLFGERGDQFYQFESPKALAFDSEGNLWVADVRRPSIYTYTPDGKVLLVTGTAARSSHPMSFSNPSSIFIDRNDRLYITDLVNKRFSVWQYLTGAYLAQHPVTEADLQAIRDEAKRIQELQQKQQK
jgi:sugar lactone lactonase YvrE